jgi:uncharacterized protein YbgA (DUF1722 family)
MAYNPLIRKFRRIKQSTSKDSDPELSFSMKWVEHLVELLKKHRGDKEFTNDVLFSAMEYFKSSMSEQEKIDVFAILLRKAVTGK